MQDTNEIQLKSTEIEGMLSDGFTQGAELQISETAYARCVDGELWRVETKEGEIMDYLNPTVVATGEQLCTEIARIIKETERSANYG